MTSILNKILGEGSIFDHPVAKHLLSKGFKHKGTTDWDDSTVTDYGDEAGHYVQHETKFRKTATGKPYKTEAFHVFKKGHHVATVHSQDHFGPVLHSVMTSN